jgi:hypothetical protein
MKPVPNVDLMRRDGKMAIIVILSFIATYGSRD